MRQRPKKRMKTAIVHDWLNGMRGGEKVLEALLELYPDSTIYTLFYERGAVSSSIARRRIITSWMDRLPGVYRFYRNLAPLFPAAVRSLKLERFDLVISSSHAAAKCVDPRGARHISYCHTPMRYIWDAADDYRLGPIRRAALGCVRNRLRNWDRETSGRVDHFIANSRFVRERIRRCYSRDAAVIPPPVDTEFFTLPQAGSHREEFYLAAGALVPYKRVDVIVNAFNQSRKPLVIAGIGPEMQSLKKIAASNIKFLGRVDDFQLRDLYRRARGLVFAAREDFGIVPVEAQSCGCPVIAYEAGGALETVQDGVSGIFFPRQTAEDIARAVEVFEGMRWSPERVRLCTEDFTREKFKARIQTFSDESLDRKRAAARASA
jgi:glycosyltransferase involved in cell wall biosynthesis